MAITLGEALVYLTADAQPLEKTLEGAKTTTTNWAANLGSSVATLVGGAVVAAGAAAVGAITGVVIASVNVASKFDQVNRDMQTQLGLTKAEAESLGDVARTVFGDNFGGSIEEAGQAVTDVLLTLGSAADNLSEDELARLTEQGLALSDAFGVDLPDSMRTATELVRTGVAKDFDDAMNIITTGFQQGLNASGDLLDTLNEYADDFGDMGLTGGEALGILNRGLEAGAFNTDKLADALNEFGVRLRDPAIGDKVRDIDAGVAGIYDEFQAGNISERDALEGMLKRIAAIEDPIKRDQAGVALFGSMWEDLGEKAILAMGGLEDGAISTADATESLNVQYDNFGNLLEGIRRRAILALEPLGEKLLAIANEIMPYVEAAFSWLEEKAPQWLDTFRGWWEEKIAPALQKITDWWNSTGAAAFTEFKDAIIALFSGDAETAWDHLMNVIDLIFGEGTSEKIETLRTDIEVFAAKVILKFNEIWDEIQLWWTKNVKPILDEVGAYFEEHWPAIAEAFTSAWEKIKAAALAVANVIKTSVWPPLKSALDSIAAAFEASGITIEDVLDVLGTIVKVTAEYIGLVLAVLLATVTSILTGLSRGFEAFVGTIIEFGSSLEMIVQGVIDLFTGLFDVIKGIVEGDGELIQQGLELMANGIWEILSGLIETMTTAIIGGIATILELISGFTEGFFGFFKELFDGLGIDVPNWLNNLVDAFHNIDWWAIGQGLIDGIKNGFLGGFDSWLEDTKGRLDDFINNLKGEAEIESPSGLTEREIGQPLGEGVVAGMDDALADLPPILSRSINRLGQGIGWLGFDRLADAQQATTDAILKRQQETFKTLQGEVDARIAEQNARQRASEVAGTVALAGAGDSYQVNLTVYADSQTNGKEVGEAAATAFLDSVRSKGGQT